MDAAVIGLSLVAAAGGILNLVFSGQELGAATTVRLLEDGDGNTVERVIPKAAFRRDVLLWDLDNESGDSELDWLQTGMVIGIAADLAQDLFVTVVDASNPKVREPLEQPGFERPVGLPLALKRQGAERLSLGHFLEGDFDRDGDTLAVRTRRYATRNARQVGARTYRGTDPPEIADRISVDLRRDMGIPDWQIDESVDLPAAEIITVSPEALRALSEGQQLYRANDMAGSRARMQEAASLDSTCAVALIGVGQLSLLMGDQQAARESFAAASRYSYRLPERMQLSIRVVDQLLLQSDPDAALRTSRYWTEIYPQERYAAAELEEILYYQRGQFGRVEDAYRRRLETGLEHLPPIQVVSSIWWTPSTWSTRRRRDGKTTPWPRSTACETALKSRGARQWISRPCASTWTGVTSSRRGSRWSVFGQ